MRRRLFNILSAGSLVLCVTLAMLWMRSYRIRELLYFDRGVICVCSSRGEMSVEYYDADFQYPWFFRNELGRRNFGFPIGFSASIHDPTDLSSPPHVRMPFWSVVAITAVSPVAWGATWLLMKRRIHQGMCLSCGYDLRATPDRCPECGTIPKSNPMPIKTG